MELELKTPCPNSPLCNWRTAHDWDKERVHILRSDYVIVDCYSCNSPMLVWFSCKEPSKGYKLLVLVDIYQKFSTNAEIRGTRTKYDHPHEHILLT